MDRRQYLALSGAAVAPLVAGCNLIGTTDETPTPTPGTTEERLAALRSSLEEAGFELGVVELDGDILVVEYHSDAAGEEAVVAEAEPVVRAYRQALEWGLEVEWLEAWLLDADGRTRAVYTVHESWVRAWADGETSDAEFFGRVAESLSWQ